MAGEQLSYEPNNNAEELSLVDCREPQLLHWKFHYSVPNTQPNRHFIIVLESHIPVGSFINTGLVQSTFLAGSTAGDCLVEPDKS